MAAAVGGAGRRQVGNGGGAPAGTIAFLPTYHVMGFTNNWLVMVKATALVSIIGLDDLVHRANLAASSTREPLVFFLLIAGLYLALTTCSLVLLAWLNRRFSLGVREVRM